MILPQSHNLQDSIKFQRELMDDMQGSDLTDFSKARNPFTNSPLTVGEIFDLHALLVYILVERNAL